MATVLPATENRYRGCWVDPNLTDDRVAFHADLAHSLTQWQTQGIKVVWLPISSQRAALISIATIQGFNFHHTNGDTLVLTKRLVAEATIPEFANHTVGVGGIVFNQRDEVLVVVEKHDMQNRPGHWKFPGGAVDKGELIRDAAIREVQEETGIHSTNLSVCAITIAANSAHPTFTRCAA